MTVKQSFSTKQSPKILIVGLQTPDNYNLDIDAYFEEFRSLVRSTGIEFQHELYFKLRSIDPATFITKGKVAELIHTVEKNGVEEIIFSEPLAMQQIRNLRKLLRAELFDRTELILDIFEKNAHSAEGKLQVELAWLQHKKARLAGKGIHFSQQAGHIGGRGPGETQKEREMQHIEGRILKIKRDLERLENVRATQRKSRLASSFPQFCLIGYTNAGKSSILNALTKSSVIAENRLFATLDTTTRELFLDERKKGLISDTVGFIQNLPHGLIEAFKSTLDELVYAHLLLHVVDIAHKNWEQQIAVVKAVLADMKLEAKPVLYLFNKSDLLAPAELEKLRPRLELYEPHVLCSTVAEHGLDALASYISAWVPPKETTP